MPLFLDECLVGFSPLWEQICPEITDQGRWNPSSAANSRTKELAGILQTVKYEQMKTKNGK